jgi:hypothetical protein
MVQRADRRGTVYALLITSIISLCNSATLNVHTQQSSLFELNGELKLVGVDDIYMRFQNLAVVLTVQIA